MAFAFGVSGGIPEIKQTGSDVANDAYVGINTAFNAVATIGRNTAYNTSQILKPLIQNGMWFRCSTAGTTAAAAPVYTSIEGNTVTDGTAVFTAVLAPQVINLGTGNFYFMPRFRFRYEGVITHYNPQQSNFMCWDVIGYGASAFWTSGKLASDGITPLWDGTHFIATRIGTNNADPTSFNLQAGAKFNFIGGQVQVAGAIGIENLTTPKSYKTSWRNTKEWGNSSSRIRAYSSLAEFEDCQFFDVAYDLFRMPAKFSVKGRGCEYLAQYVGSGAGGADAKFVASKIENIDGTYDFDNYFSGHVEIEDSKAGIDLKVVSQYPNSAYWIKHCLPEFQNIKITPKDTSGVAITNINFFTKETPSNSPTVPITTNGGLKTWDFRSAAELETATNASGIATLRAAYNVFYWEGSFKESQRYALGPVDTLGVARPRMILEARSPNYKTLQLPIDLGYEGLVEAPAGMVALDTPMSVSTVAASAITGISLAPSGSLGGTVTISSAQSVKTMWNYYRWWISQFANKSSVDSWTFISGKLDTGNWNIVIGTNVTVTGLSTESFKSTGTITNNGSILIPYEDTSGSSTVLTIDGIAEHSAVLIEDNNGVEKFFSADATGSVTIYLPPSATGSWYYAVEKYGNQRQSDYFTFSGGYKKITVKELPDNKLLLSKAQAQALTLIKNPDEAYDIIALLREIKPYISFGQITSKDGSTLNTEDYSIKLNQNAIKTVEVSYTNKIITLKSAIMESGSVCNLIKMNPPAEIYISTNEVITVNIEDANGDSTVEVKGVEDNLVDVWKCVNGTVNVDYATGTKIGSNIGSGKFRFVHQDGFKLIFFDKASLMARDCSMSKGSYTLGWFIYDDEKGGLDKNQAAKFNSMYNTINVVDENINDIETKVDDLGTSIEGIPVAVWSATERTLTSAGASGATIAEIQALNLAQEFTLQGVKTKVDSLSNYNDSGLIAKIDAVKTVADSIKTLVEDKTGYSLTMDQVDSIAAAVESHLLDDGDSQQLINAIVTAIGNSNVDETILVAAIRNDLERTGGAIDAVKAKVDTLQNADFTVTNNKIDSVKTKVDTLENYDSTNLSNKIDAIIPKLEKMNEGLQLLSNFEPYDEELP